MREGREGGGEGMGKCYMTREGGKGGMREEGRDWKKVEKDREKVTRRGDGEWAGGNERGREGREGMGEC